MNVFIPYKDVKKVAKVLDKKRLNKQILECDQLLRAIEYRKNPIGDKPGYVNHPCTIMYQNHADWLAWYRDVLKGIDGTEPIRPHFLDFTELIFAHRARLYQKDNNHYERFRNYANFTDLNWYVCGDAVRKYKDGKLVSSINIDKII